MKVPTTGYHRLMEALSIVGLLWMVLPLLLFWNSLPEKIPAHFNFAGEVDRWGGRGELLAPVILALVLYAGISLLQRFPQIWNTGVTVTEQNREPVYRELTNMIVTTKALMLLPTFALISRAQARGVPLPGWFTAMQLLLWVGVLILFGVRLARAGKKGR